MTPSPTCSYRTLCVLPRCAFWAIKRSDQFLLCRDTRINVKAGNPPLTSRKRGVCGSNFPTGWDIFMGPQRHILGRNRVDWCIGLISGTRALGVGCGIAEQNTEKKIRQSTISPIWAAEPRSPAYHYELWLHGGPTDLINCPNFCFDRLRGFCSVWCWKLPFPIRSDHALPRLHVIRARLLLFPVFGPPYWIPLRRSWYSMYVNVPMCQRPWKTGH